MNNLKLIRARKGLSQLAVSKLTNIAPTDISRIENGWIIPYAGWQKRLSEALECPVSEFQFPSVGGLESIGAFARSLANLAKELHSAAAEFRKIASETESSEHRAFFLGKENAFMLGALMATDVLAESPSGNLQHEIGKTDA
jgi:transcriptional regulator with XRE-family HTH domain